MTDIKVLKRARPPSSEKVSLVRTPIEDANRPPAEAVSLLGVTTRTKTMWTPTSPLQRHNRRKSKENVNQLVEIFVTTTRCLERHSNVVLGMKAVFVACDHQL